MERRSSLRLLQDHPVLLTDGGIETRLIYEFGCDLPEFASFLPLFRDGERQALETIYRSYLQVADRFRLPMQIGTPTWRAHPDCLKRLGFGAVGDLERVNGAAVGLLTRLRDECTAGDLVLIAGVIGPQRDGYDPCHAPGQDEARGYHSAQAQVLATLGADLLYAPTFASSAELRGVAEAMAATGLPYALAPVIDVDGRLLDGRPLAEVIEWIDGEVVPRPLHYLIGCVHPTRFRVTAEAPGAALLSAAGRLAGLKANASTLPPEELDKLDHLDAGLAADFARQMHDLHRDFGLRILGGCCGTNHQHIHALAELVAAGASRPPK